MNAEQLKLLQITKLLAVEMTARSGELWRAKSKHWHADLYSPSAWLDLHIDGNRLVIRASRPEQMAWGASGEQITADINRTPEAIAGDIERRLLQNARETWKLCRAYSRKRKDEIYKFRATVHLFDKFATLKRLNDSHGDIYTPSTTIEITNEKVTDLNIRHLNNEQALFILNYLQDFPKPSD